MKIRSLPFPITRRRPLACRRTPTAALVVAVLAGCGGSETMSPVDAGSTPDGLATADVDLGSFDTWGSDGVSNGPSAMAGCTYDNVRTVGPQESTVAGGTLAEISTRFGFDLDWSCSLTWGTLPSEPDATFSPHDTTSRAVMRIALTSAKEYSGGHAPAGSRTSCPAYLALETIVALRTEDGGFAESFDLPGTVSAFAPGYFNIKVDLRALGFYAFGGTYAFRWLSSWPTLQTTFAIVISAAQGDVSSIAEGMLQESARRETAGDAGVLSGGSGDGIISKTAGWLCPG